MKGQQHQPLGQRLKSSLRSVLYGSGLWPLWHRVRNRNSLTTFMFHRVLPTTGERWAQAERAYTLSVENFELVLEFIQAHYSVVSMAEVADASRSRQLNRLPACPALITFDDGWADTLEHAAPVLASKGLPATVFVVPEAVDSPEPRWWADALVEALSIEAARAKLQANGLPTADVHSCHAQLASLGAGHRWWDGMDESPPGGYRQMVTHQGLRELEALGFTIGVHGYTHAPLAAIQEMHAEEELRKAKDWLVSGNWGATAVHSLAFPHGSTTPQVSKAAAGYFGMIFDSRALLKRLVDDSASGSPFPRLHIPADKWTCNERGQIERSKLASFCFFRMAV